MKTTYTEQDLIDDLVDVLKNVGTYHHDSQDKRCFLSAYQLAVLLYEMRENELHDSNIPDNIGGSGEGRHYSLSQRIARTLSQYTLNDEAPVLEVGFLNTKGLKGFEFIDEEGHERMPSKETFSMFRYIGN